MISSSTRPAEVMFATEEGCMEKQNQMKIFKKWLFKSTTLKHIRKLFQGCLFNCGSVYHNHSVSKNSLEFSITDAWPSFPLFPIQHNEESHLDFFPSLNSVGFAVALVLANLRNYPHCLNPEALSSISSHSCFPLSSLETVICGFPRQVMPHRWMCTAYNLGARFLSICTFLSSIYVTAHV